MTFSTLLGGAMTGMGAEALEPAFLSREPAVTANGAAWAVTLNKGIRSESRILVNLSESVSLVAEGTRVEENAGGGFTWVGRIEGESLSEVILVSHGNVAAGHVSRPMVDGTVLYTVRPGERDLCILSEPAPGEVPEGCLEVAVPGVAQAGAGAGATGVSRTRVSAQGRGRRSAALAGAVYPAATAENPAVIDVMVVYSSATGVRYGGTAGVQALIQEAIASANTGYENSGVHARMRIVHSAPVTYVETGNMSDALSRLAGTADGFMDTVHAWRDTYGADLVVLLDEDTNSCGIGYQMSAVGTEFAPYAFSVVSSGCVANFSLAHEAGHNMGCLHDRESTTLTGAFPYSYGHRICAADGSGFRTVMSYNCVSNSVPRVNYFSNPNVTFNGLPTGVASTQPLPADNAQSLNNTVHTAAAFRGEVAVAPVAPSGLTATAVSSARVDLAWQDNATSEVGYRVERSLDGVVYVLVGEVGPNGVSYSDGTVSGGTAYWYRVVATGWSIDSMPSGVAVVSTPMVPPAAPTGLTAVAAGSALVNLAWVDGSLNETGFRIERSTNGTAFVALASVGMNVVVYGDATVVAGRTYQYRVVAVGAGGDSAASNVASTSTPAVVPAVPTGLSAVAASTTRVNLAWTDAANNETGFRIERSTNGTAFVTLASVAANVVSYGDTTAAAGRTYWYRVLATGTSGNSAPSAVASATTPLVAPTSLKAAAASTTSIKLTWLDKSTNESGFEIQRSADGGVTFATVATSAANATSYTSAGLTSKKTYQYRIRAVSAVSVSPWTAVVAATTK